MSTTSERQSQIIEGMDHISVPKPAKNLVKCSNCEDNVPRSYRRNCKLCGFLFCSNCTGEFVVLKKFQQSQLHTGTSPVCFACRDSCLMRMLLEQDFKNPSKVPPTRHIRLVSNFRGDLKLLPPKITASISKECFMCSRDPKMGVHHCSSCLRSVCGSCSVRMDLPDGFRMKSFAKRLVRVCHECRFLIRGKFGIRPDDKYVISNLMSLPSDVGTLSEVEEEDYSIQEDEFTGRFDRISHLSKALPSLSEYHDVLEEEDEVSDFPGLRKAFLPIFWEDCSDELFMVPLHKVESLLDVHNYIIVNKPELLKSPFVYLFNGQPVHWRHWEIYMPKAFTHGIEIRIVSEQDEMYRKYSRSSLSLSPRQRHLSLS